MVNAQELTVLKKKLATYKQMLESLKSEEIVEEKIITKKEYDELKEQVVNLEAEIRTRLDQQHTQFETNVEQFTSQIQSVQNAINYLKEDVEELMNSVNNLDLNDLKNKIQMLINLNSSSSLIDKENEQTLQKEDQAYDRQMNSMSKLIRPSGYLQLKQLMPPPMSNDKKSNHSSIQVERIQLKHDSAAFKHANRGREMKRNSNVAYKRHGKNNKKTNQPYNHQNLLNEKKVNEDDEHTINVQEEGSELSKQLMNGIISHSDIEKKKKQIKENQLEENFTKEPSPSHKMIEITNGVSVPTQTDQQKMIEDDNQKRKSPFFTLFGRGKSFWK